MILQACVDNFNATLDTWITFLEDNYDDCLSLADSDNIMYFPDPVNTGVGAGVNAAFTIDCTMDVVEVPYMVESDCSESLNPPEAAVPSSGWACDNLTGTISVTGPEGVEVSALVGEVVFRRTCNVDSCSFSIDSLELSAGAFSAAGYTARDMQASIAWPGFGLRTDDNGTIAKGMFGLNVTLRGETPETTSGEAEPFAFTMANSDLASFIVGEGTFQIVDTYFAWDDYKVSIVSDLTSACVAL